MIRVLIADDHAIVRKGLRQLVREQTAQMEIAEASDGQMVLELVSKGNVDVLVLDLTMPGRNGLDILQAVKALQPTLPVLILSMHPEEQYALRVLKAGAAGYMSKEAAPDELVPAIEKIARGGKYMSATLADLLLFDLTQQAEKPAHDLLSDREHTVLIMLGAGQTVSEIAQGLSLSVKTISTYRASILEKLNLRTTAELIRYVVDHNLA